ncbi:hypothetical protein MLD38_016455 [Melastoma candidum]|uniref:Uncharacterized protein n=1 Tax=Melastoma candidum TaxID=119954 RepID=A0ACB9QML7_9MYRT|nr:hypothetical protein MLD38_016455 [Melastoma candidum]
MADGISSFWGPVTSTRECCERNYNNSSHVAEFYNTLSNIPCILLAIFGLRNALQQRFERRFSFLYVSNVVLAIGSMLHHATLRSGQQQSDETPMVWAMLLYIYILFSPDWHYRRTMPTFLIIYGTAFTISHSFLRFSIGFNLHYIMLCLLCMPRVYKYYIYTDDKAARHLGKVYVVTLMLGSLCWLSDWLLCEEMSRWHINPQGHALWHVFMGFNTYFANTFLMFCRAEQRNWYPQVVRALGILPYVKIKKRKAQ